MKQLISILFVSLFCLPVHGQMITTVVAGDSTCVDTNNIPAIATCIYGPNDVAVDQYGNYYITETHKDRIRKVDTHGIITTIAGNERPGYSGDDSAATNAKIFNPQGIAVDAKGNIYFSDANYVIRRIDTSGIIHAFAGKFTVSGFNGDDQPATDASLYAPQGIACDDRGNVFICDMLNCRIRRVDSMGMITTVAGDGGLYYSGDGGMATNTSIGSVLGVALSGAGDVYFTDGTSSIVCKIDNSGVVSTVAGVAGSHGYNGDGIQATAALLSNPWGIALDANNDIFIADDGEYRIRKIDPSGMISTYAGTGVDSFNGNIGLASAIDVSPLGIAVNGEGGLYIADYFNYRVRYIESTEGVSGVSEKAARLSLYPDPTTDGRITVDLEDNIPGRAQVHVWDMLGRELMSAEIEANKPEQLAINAPPGIYLLSVAHNGYSHSTRLVIAR